MAAGLSIASARVAIAFVCLLLTVFVSTATAHWTGLPHRELTPEQISQLHQMELAPGTQTSGAATLVYFDPNKNLNSFGALSRAWVTHPAILLTLAAMAGLYGFGLARFWSATHIGAAISITDAALYGLGWLSLVIALVSPLHPWGEVLFSAHMTQHEILMLVSAPLLVMGRPVIACLWALPAAWRRAVGRLGATAGGRLTWKALADPFGAFIFHAVCLWVWHIPSWFEATLRSDFIHSLQHASFLGSAIIFWWAILNGHKRALGYGMGIMYLFLTAVHSGILGALLIFSRVTWYPSYASTAASWGLTALEDQQLGGLIMWVPAGVVYLFAAVLLMVGTLRVSERRVLMQEAKWAEAVHLQKSSGEVV